jgi:hypothetical protein
MCIQCLAPLAAVAGPQPEDVPTAFDSDRQGHVNGPVGNRPVANLHVDGVNEDDGIDGVEGPVCYSAMPSRTLSVIAEIVWRDTSAP